MLIIRWKDDIISRHKREESNADVVITQLFVLSPGLGGGGHFLPPSTPLSTDKSGAVLYRDFVTILWGASMQDITQLATSQSPKPPSPSPNL
jgi:hypothetical protein